MSLFGRLFRKPIKEFKLSVTLYRWGTDAEKVAFTYECTSINEAIEGAAYCLGLDAYGIGHTEKIDGVYQVVLFERRPLKKVD